MLILPAPAGTMAKAGGQDQGSAEVNGWAISFAHDWREKSRNRLICIRCLAETEIGQSPVTRCVQHFEDKASGYMDEAAK